MSAERKIVLEKVNDVYGFKGEYNNGPSERFIISRRDGFGIGFFHEPGDEWYAFDKAIPLGRILVELGFTPADCEDAIDDYMRTPDYVRRTENRPEKS